jgi:alkaline phosphatase
MNKANSNVIVFDNASNYYKELVLFLTAVFVLSFSVYVRASSNQHMPLDYHDQNQEYERNQQDFQSQRYNQNQQHRQNQQYEQFTHEDSYQQKFEKRNVILFIGDGMHMEHEIAASRYLTGKSYSLIFHHFPYHNVVTTWDVTTYNRYAWNASLPEWDPETYNPAIGYDISRGGINPHPLDSVIDEDYFLEKLPAYHSDYSSADYPATDSAAAGTALATGYKTDKGNISWESGDPEDGKIATIAEMARDQRDMGIGVVSSVPFSHATPASFVSHNISRNNYHRISDEIILFQRPDVVIGGGHPKWTGTYKYITEWSHNQLEYSRGYEFVERDYGVHGGHNLQAAAERSRFNGKNLFGLFGGKGGNWDPPIPMHNPGRPMIMRGSIENPTLREATVAALTRLSAEDNGFFLMVEQGDIDWANHANDYEWMLGTVCDLDAAVSAAVRFVEQPGDDITWSNTMILVTSDHGNSYMRLDHEHPLGIGELPDNVGNLVSYSSKKHTNELVNLYAIGGDLHKGDYSYFDQYEGSWYPGTSILDNTHVYEIMRDFLQLSE